ncbi:MAG: hypothetical protein E7568_02660 [Ruminococcaceae bacterium]|nr:hypothetical protein [Oscillospiraceae bacterium]
MKRILCIIFSLLLMVFVFPFSVLANNADTIYLSPVSAKAGETITLPVSYKTETGIYVARIFIEYDQNVFEFVKTENLNERFGHTSSFKDGVVTVIADGRDVANVTGDFRLFSVTFKVKEDVEKIGYFLKIKGEASSIKSDEGKTEVVSNFVSDNSVEIYVVCSKHKFTVPHSDGKKCENCEAIELSSSGEIVLPSPEQDDTPPKVNNENGEKETDKNDMTEAVLLIGASGFAVILFVIVLLFLRKRKKEAA